MRDLFKKIFSVLRHDIFPWWRSSEWRTAWGGFLALLLLSIGSVVIAVIFNNWQRSFYNTIQEKNLSQFFKQVQIFFPIIAIFLINFCTRSYLMGWLSFRWRRWVTERLHGKWLAQKNFYKIAFLSEEIDNPDQRIAQDVDLFCSTVFEFFFTFFQEGINCVTFSIILYGISSHFVFHLGKYHLHFPGLLLLAAFTYALLGTLFTFKVGGPLIDLDRLQEKKEANFRYRLMRIFERREEIATWGGEAVEGAGLKEAFREITQNFYAILQRQIPINLFQNFYLNISQFVPLFLVGPIYFEGIITLGVLVQVQGIFTNIKDSLSTLVMDFQKAAGGLAAWKRLKSFHHLMDISTQPGRSLTINQDQFVIPSLTITTPQHQKIWVSPEVFLKPGDRKLLMAPSGTGKSSFFRALSGIYPYVKEGALALHEELFFMPQRPYMPVGNLRQCLSYPSVDFPEEQILELLREVELERLIPFLDHVDDYHHRLSLGEQQRIGLLRILLHCPKWVFLDEPIAQLHHGLALKLMELLSKRLPESAIFVVSHQEIPQFVKVTG
jgi:vitamin B12/bleomycin/antimicrobial peptide transport system ATP-binding/permease protein